MKSALIATAQKLAQLGNAGTAGNVSVRHAQNLAEGFLITPSGRDYATLAEADIPWVALADGASSGLRAPSSEWRMHAAVYRERPEAQAILHAHSPFATTLACLRGDIPPFHYMIARFGGDSVRCAPYALFGSEELAQAALIALPERCACLLANHGMLVFGDSLKQVFALAQELEALCEQYWRALCAGGPAMLDAREMDEALAAFGHYGRQTP
ncbi:MAG: class II aldolase/adducin family protein [Zoogloeaceae bacterium]|jgi:L-fuculose-phosphate aldolase|nr:class II aldolase/adducin family protein [Zoogloeaceae bacterium]